MKRLILTTLAVLASAALGYAQGTVTIANTTSTYFISTNTGSATGITIGTGFYYTVLTTADVGQAAPGTTLQDLINSADWTWTGVTGSGNGLTHGGIASAGSQAATGWNLPLGPNYSNGPTNYYVIVGWSAGEGTSWSAVSTLINTTGLVSGAGDFFGMSSVGFQVAGGTSPLVAVNLFGDQTTIPGAGLTAGFQLMPIPEPSTIALAGLGGLSLLLFRRRK